MKKFPATWLLLVTVILAYVAMMLAVAFLAGCTITPEIVHSSQPSFDGGSQDSGFLGFAEDNSAYISDEGKARYNALAAEFGARFTVPLAPNDGISPEPTIVNNRRAWLIDAEHLVKFQTMNRWRKQKGK